MKRSTTVLLTILLIAVGFLFHSLRSDGASYKVIAISDGDTITVLAPDKTQIKVRLAEIDAPEKKQAFGTKSKEALAEKIFGKEIRLEGTKKDRYGRLIGKVYIDNRYINQEMIEEGWVWHYTEYSKSSELESAQQYAKKHKVGLWADVAPTPPWEFRKK